MAGFDINWSMAAPVNVGGQWLAGVDRGTAIRKESDTQKALSAFSGDPSAGNLNALMGLSPQLAMRASEFQTARAEQDRKAQFRSAQSDYLLAGDAAQRPADPAAMPGAPDAQGQPAHPFEAFDPAHRAPVDSRTEAFRRMAVYDPEGASAARKQEYDFVKQRLDVADGAYDYAIARIANVADDAGYRAAVANAAERFAPLGIDIRSMVPEAYPGPDGLRRLLMSAMEAKDQIAATDRSLRLEWDIRDDEIDNQRSDRNVDSQISDRVARRDLTARGQNMTDSRGRRGQDMSSQDRRYGIETTDQRTREGWVTPKAGRSRGGSARPATPSAALPLAKTPADAAKLPRGTRFRTPDGNVKVVP